jgi:hypothetical protein
MDIYDIYMKYMALRKLDFIIVLHKLNVFMVFHKLGFIGD